MVDRAGSELVFRADEQSEFGMPERINVEDAWNVADNLEFRATALLDRSTVEGGYTPAERMQRCKWHMKALGCKALSQQIYELIAPDVDVVADAEAILRQA